jgi:hypothetical protein
MSWLVIFRVGIEFSSDESGTTLAAGIQPVSAGDASPTGNVAAQCYDENKGRKQ